MNFFFRYSYTTYLWAEAVSRKRSVKKVFLKILQNSQESTCVEASPQLTRVSPATFFKKKFSNTDGF